MTEPSSPDAALTHLAGIRATIAATPPPQRSALAEALDGMVDDLARQLRLPDSAAPPGEPEPQPPTATPRGPTSAATAANPA